MLKTDKNGRLRETLPIIRICVKQERHIRWNVPLLYVCFPFAAMAAWALRYTHRKSISICALSIRRKMVSGYTVE